MNSTPSPRYVAAMRTMARIQRGDLPTPPVVTETVITQTASQSRRQRAAKNGYRGPLTSAEHAERALNNS